MVMHHNILPPYALSCITDILFRVMDTNGYEFSKACRPGEVLVRGPSVMSCYSGNQEATELSASGGWLKTGDVGYHKEGKWYTIDRLKVSSALHSLYVRDYGI